MKTSLNIKTALVAISSLALFGFSGCVTPRENLCGETWSFPDCKYRTVNYRADLGKWQAWQYSNSYWDAEHHRAWMEDLFECMGSRQPTGIEKRPK